MHEDFKNAMDSVVHGLLTRSADEARQHPLYRRFAQLCQAPLSAERRIANVFTFVAKEHQRLFEIMACLDQTHVAGAVSSPGISQRGAIRGFIGALFEVQRWEQTQNRVDCYPRALRRILRVSRKRDASGIQRVGEWERGQPPRVYRRRPGHSAKIRHTKNSAYRKLTASIENVPFTRRQGDLMRAMDSALFESVRLADQALAESGLSTTLWRALTVADLLPRAVVRTGDVATISACADRIVEHFVRTFLETLPPEKFMD